MSIYIKKGIKFDFSNQFWYNIDVFWSNSNVSINFWAVGIDSDHEFGSKKLIKSWFDHNMKWNLVLDQLNHLQVKKRLNSSNGRAIDLYPADPGWKPCMIALRIWKFEYTCKLLFNHGSLNSNSKYEMLINWIFWPMKHLAELIFFNFLYALQ